MKKEFRIYNNPIFIYGTFGAWDGSKPVFANTRIHDLKELLSTTSTLRGGDSELSFFVDGDELKATESHHDGINHFVYRVLRSEYTVMDLADETFLIDDKTKINKYFAPIGKDALLAGINEVAAWQGFQYIYN